MWFPDPWEAMYRIFYRYIIIIIKSTHIAAFGTDLHAYATALTSWISFWNLRRTNQEGWSWLVYGESCGAIRLTSGPGTDPEPKKDEPMDRWVRMLLIDGRPPGSIDQHDSITGHKRCAYTPSPTMLPRTPGCSPFNIARWIFRSWTYSKYGNFSATIYL